ncbi:preprotein translocase subunit YajC [Singulisphaera rosea]
MPDLFVAIPLVFAQNAPAENPNGAAGGLGQLLPILVIALFWGYFLLFRPQQQQEKKRREMIAALKKNDKVLTSAGIYGTVMSVDSDQDKVVLRVDDDRGVKLAFSKAAVVKVIDSATEKAGEST